MSKGERKLSLGQAEGLAEKVVSQLAPFCERVEVAGSVRRRRPWVGDVEVVAIPRVIRKRADLIRDVEVSLLDVELNRLMEVGKLRRIKGGPRYKQFALVEAERRLGWVVRLDLFVTEADCWGACFMIRTGPAEFSRRMVTSREKGGCCPVGMRFEGNRLWRDGVVAPTPEETDVFEALGVEWVEPAERG